LAIVRTPDGLGSVAMASEVEDRITELEIKLSYQDRLIDTLNQVIIELRGQLDDQGRRLKRLEQQLFLGIPDAAPNEKPPHY
jgi:SlyX protein